MLKIELPFYNYRPNFLATIIDQRAHTESFKGEDMTSIIYYRVYITFQLPLRTATHMEEGFIPIQYMYVCGMHICSL